jgi:hypothetical protein
MHSELKTTGRKSLWSGSRYFRNLLGNWEYQGKKLSVKEILWPRFDLGHSRTQARYVSTNRPIDK